MACTVSIVEHESYLSATIVGDNTMETLYQYMKEIPEACMRTGKLRVLVIVSLTGPELPMLDVYQAVSAGSDAAAGLGMRVAYVDQNENHSIDTMLLAENVAGGRGIPVCSFRDVDLAIQWLITDQDL